MVRPYFPQHFPGPIDTNTKFPPQGQDEKFERDDRDMLYENLPTMEYEDLIDMEYEG